MAVTVEERTLRFRRPVRTGFGELRERTILELTVDGGRGEAAPLEPYDGVSLREARSALEAYVPVLERVGEISGSDVLDACRAIADLPQALAAVDLALWDRAGRREGRPIAALLTDHPAREVPVNA
ncbi:MAG: hypothetical protein M3389_11570, partial [Actinomycetota bacterium]|nr:hypothetical protein [Actinomycetota bacterium]